MLNVNKKFIGLGLLLAGVNSIAQNQQRPNLIFVMADQLRTDVLGCNGDKKAITPNIDRFAKNAVNFKNATAVTPVSAACRSCLFTGKYTSSTGMIINEINMNPNHRTLAHVLGDAGYNLGYIGKVHLNDQYERPFKKGPERMGFDGYWAGYSFNHISHHSFYFTDDENGNQKRVNLYGKYGPQEFTTLAVNYIEKASREDQPFALVLSWNPPHDPWTQKNTKKECYEKFKDTKFELPENFKDKPDPYMDRYPQEYFKGQTEWREDFIHGGGYQEVMRNYYAMVNSIDEQFGRVLKTVDSLGIADNTIIVFTSDHGEMFTSQGRMYKLTFYDEAANIPLLVSYPPLKTKGKTDICLNTPDLTPTLLGLMGLHDRIPAEMEGQDLSFVVRKEKGKEPPFAFLQGMGHTYQWRDGFEWRAVRDKRYTYAKYLRDGSEVLYDRKKDPHMKENVIDNPKYAATRDQLRSKMAAKMTELNDEFHTCTWYRDHWMYKNFSIQEAAKGKFGPLPPIEPQRGQKNN